MFVNLRDFWDEVEVLSIVKDSVSEVAVNDCESVSCIKGSSLIGGFITSLLCSSRTIRKHFEKIKNYFKRKFWKEELSEQLFNIKIY